MSQLAASDPPGTGAGSATIAPRWRSSLTWMTVACILLVSSGVARSWQDRRHLVESSYTESCPFPLKSIPTTLGGWKLVDGGDRSLDPLTMRITGGTDHLLRTYVDELTGVSLVALILFGPVEPVIPHTPEVCYPACGFTLADEVSDRVIQSEGGITSRFRSAVYAKSGGRTSLREEVYYSFRLEGQWSPDVGSGRKFPRRNPSVFKVQVQRRVADRERRDGDDPIEQFLKYLIPAIEHQVASSKKSPPTSIPTSMGGVSPATMRGEPGDGLALAAFNDLQGDFAPVGRSLSRVARDPGQTSGEDRYAPDQTDHQQDGGQVDGQGHLHRDADRIAAPARAAIHLKRWPVRPRVLRESYHGRHSLS